MKKQLVIFVFFAAKNNIGVVIALWAPIILVSYPYVPVMSVLLFLTVMVSNSY